MQKTKYNRFKMIRGLFAGVVLLTPFLHAGAQTLTPQFGDLILGFRASGGQGQSLNLEVDLGNVSNFYDAVAGTTIPLPALAVQDLVNTYGASWSTRTDLVWGAVSTTGRVSGTPDGHASVATLWATAPNGQAAWNRGSTNAQKNASATIEVMYETGSAGTLYGATPTTNSSAAAVIDATQTGSWSAQDLKTLGTSFVYFNPTIDNPVTNPAVGQAVSQLYELPPASTVGIPGTLLGNLILKTNGLSFHALAVAPLRILSIARSTNDIVLEWTAPGGTTNAVQTTGGSNGNYSTNGYADISGLITNPGIAGVGVTNYYTESLGATNQVRYYRIRQVP
jgi:hypothetical protein